MNEWGNIPTGLWNPDGADGGTLPGTLAHPPAAHPQAPGDGPALHVAVVHGIRAVHLIAVDESREALLTQIAHHVRRNAEVQLWPEDSRCVSELLTNGKVETAIELYFRRVGQRWDHEWLVVQMVGGERVSGDGPASTLQCCPFCEAAPVRQQHPAIPEVVRVACTNDDCRVRPATEYLLEGYGDELRNAWNTRR